MLGHGRFRSTVGIDCHDRTGATANYRGAVASILLVADDNWVRHDVVAALSDPATQLTVCDDPKNAAETASESPFDAIVVDMQIKNMGGMAVTRLIHDAISAGECPPTPIVMLLDRSADVFLAKRAGTQAHLLKPFTAQDLRAVMSELVN